MKRIVSFLLLIFIVISIFYCVLPEKTRNQKILDYTLEGTPYFGMSEEEFEKEMQKGVQGDFTLEQVDSMQKEWTRLDSIESAKP